MINLIDAAYSRLARFRGPLVRPPYCLGLRCLSVFLCVTGSGRLLDVSEAGQRRRMSSSKPTLEEAVSILLQNPHGGGAARSNQPQPCPSRSPCP